MSVLVCKPLRCTGSELVNGSISVSVQCECTSDAAATLFAAST